MTQSAARGASLGVTYAGPLFDVSGYATMARALVLGLDALGVQVTAQPLWDAGVPELRPIAALPSTIELRPLGCGGVPIEASAPILEGDRCVLFLRGRDGSVYEYRTPVETAHVTRLLALARPGRRAATPYVMHMIPANAGTDFYAIGRRVNPGHPYYIGSTMFETAGIPPSWPAAANAMDEIWVPTAFNVQTFADGGIARDKLHVLPLGIDAERFHPARVAPMPIAGRKGFTFLSVFQWTRRKGWDVLLRAYLEAFDCDDDVCLVLRAYQGVGESVADRLQRAIVELGYDPARCPEIVLLDACVPDALLPSLYAACDAYVSPSRGEGWGMPYLEAMALAKPVIGTRFGGNLEFMTDENSFLIDVEGLTPVTDEQVRDNSVYAGQQWAEPSVAHSAALMRRVYEDRDERSRRAARGRADVEARWTVRHQAERVQRRLIEIDRLCAARTPVAPPARPAPLAIHAVPPRVHASVDRAASRGGTGGRVHVVLADEGWILEQCGRELERRLPYVHVGTAPDPAAAINYYVNYAAWRGRCSPIELALFTHLEERAPEAVRRFHEVAHAVTACIGMSRRYVETLREAGVREVHEITPGVDLDAFRPVVRIAVIGRTYPTGRKGEDLVRAVVDEAGIEWRFTGEGWPGPAEPCSPEQMPALYNAVDYVLVPAYYEGGPMPLLEALACGKEVIAPPVGFVPDYPHIEFRTGDVADLRRVLRGVVAKRMALRAAVAHRSWDAWAAAHETLFRRFLGDASAPVRHDIAPVGGPRSVTDAPRAPRSATAAPIKVLLALHAPERGLEGGPSIRVPRLQARLRALGLVADVTSEPLPDPSGYDVVHVFNVWAPDAALAQLRHVHARGVPIVFSPIYLDLAELTWATRAVPEAFGGASSPADLARRLDAVAAGTLVVDGYRRGGCNEIVPGYFDAVREMIGLADHLITLSRFEAERLAAIGAPRVPFTLVRNAVEVERFASASPEPFARRYGVRDYVLCVGRVERRKNQLMLAHALSESGVALVLLGAPAERDYADLVRRRGGPALTMIEALPHDSELLPSAYAGARVLALPSWCEGAPLTALEAAAAGTALVLSDRSAEAEYFGAMAAYCDPADVASIRAAVLQAHRQPRDETRRAALRAHVAAYTWDDAVCGTLEAYARALEHARTRIGADAAHAASAR